ncbi:MAG: DUF5335 family protein [Gemmatimonadaceae bacterium]
MSVTTRIPPERLSAYFDAFTKKFLRDANPETVNVEVLSPDWGEQFEAEGAHLMGITYDRKANSLEFELEAGDHRVYQPSEVWAVEEPDGFVSSIEVVRPDGVKDVVNVKRAGDAPPA